MKFELRSPSWEGQREIPREFTCEGANVSPELEWSEPPAGTREFALIMDDPDAPSGTFTHWVVYNLPRELRKLPQKVPATGNLPGGGVQARNSFGKTGYGGPCPPPGHPHRYFFRLYALKSSLGLKPGASREQVENAMRDQVLGSAELMGKFGR